MRDYRGIIFASLYTIIKKQNGSYLFIGAKSMPYHRSKKVLFLPYLSFETKKSFLVGGWVGGGGWKVTLVSVCVHFLKLLDTQTHRNGHRAWQKVKMKNDVGNLNKYPKMIIWTYFEPCFIFHLNSLKFEILPAGLSSWKLLSI